MSEPTTWHYGLVARWWAEFNTDGPEIDYYRTFIERFGQPVLDAPCGTGRLLIPYVRDGLDVDGCDVSGDMLARCRERADREGLDLRLYRQALHELELPRTYRTIVVCGGFGIGASRAQDKEALRRVARQLEPGGALILDKHVPYARANGWRYWTSEERQKLPLPWPEHGSRKRAADGDELELSSRLAGLDPLDQLVALDIRVILRRDDAVVRQEEYSLHERMYFKSEMLDMLAEAGFQDVEVRGDYRDEPATADSNVLVFVARR